MGLLSAIGSRIKSNVQPEEPVAPPAEPQGLGLPIEQHIGPVPADGVFDDFTAEQQVVVSANRTFTEANYYPTQSEDWAVIRGKHPGTNYASAADTNQQFIAFMVNGPGSSTYGSTAVNTSWSFYMNWIRGVDDGASHFFSWGGGWDGTEADFKDYRQWYVNEKKSSVYAVPHNGW